MEPPQSRIVGRDAELEAVDAFLTRARSGCAALTIEGETGIGKTSVWWEGLRRADEHGSLVMVARPTEAEAGLSFSGLADLFSGIDEEIVNQLAFPQREAIDAALLRAAMPPDGVEGRALCASVLSLLRLLSTDRAVVVAVDDAHWLDSPSARALSYAVRRLEPEPVGFLTSVRAGEEPLPDFVHVARPIRTHTVSLGPLSVGALHEVIKNHTEVSLARPTLVHLARISGGNPFYALEIVAELERRPPHGGRLPTPASVGDLVKARVGRLAVASRRALLSAAALSQPTIHLVDLTALAPAERAGIVSVDEGRIRFAHPLFASAVYDLADAGERRAMHKQLADLVSDREERARHLALACVGADANVVSELDAAAVHASARGAPQAACDLVELALGLTPSNDVDSRTRRLLAASRFSFDAGDLSHAEILLERALREEPVGLLRAEIFQLLGRLHARGRSFADAQIAASEALVTAGTSPAMLAGIELDIAYYFVCTGDFRPAHAHARSAVDLADGPPMLGVLAHALGVLTMTEFLCGEGVHEERMTRALELEHASPVRAWQMRPTFIWGLLALWTGRVGEALRSLDDLLEQSHERGEESPVPVLSHYLTWAHLWRGDLSGARRVADQARETAALVGDAAARGGAYTASALVHGFDGSIELARDEAATAISCFESLGWRTGTTWPLWAIGSAELSAGDARAVDTALGPRAAMLVSADPVDPVLGVFLPDEIEALVELGQLERAEPLVAWLEERGEELDRPWALAVAGRCRGLLYAARRANVPAKEAFTRAISQHDRADMPFERSRTLLVWGRALRRMGERAEAKTMLSDALVAFEQLGASLWAERTRADLERLRGRAMSSQALTPTEARVAELAASGLSNREVGERAFLSLKTVEANLTRVYRKLGIRSRAGLARALEAAGETPDT